MEKPITPPLEEIEEGVPFTVRLTILNMTDEEHAEYCVDHDIDTMQTGGENVQSHHILAFEQTTLDRIDRYTGECTSLAASSHAGLALIARAARYNNLSMQQAIDRLHAGESLQTAAATYRTA